LADIAAQARDVGADVTFCQDPDADRLAVIDENGRYIGEECTLALCVEHVLRGAGAEAGTGEDTGGARCGGAIVTNCSTSRMSEAIAIKRRVPFHRSAVGEANVVDAMMTHGAVLGGEGNGGVIDPRVGWVRDSFVGMAQILDMMAATGRPISQLADSLPQYAIQKTKVTLDPRAIGKAFDALEADFAGTAAAAKSQGGQYARCDTFEDADDRPTANRLDGLRLDWPQGAWLLVRASNTEPVVRVIAEAATVQRAEQLCRRAESVLEAVG
jgi:phosphomannomutase